MTRLQACQIDAEAPNMHLAGAMAILSIDRIMVFQEIFGSGFADELAGQVRARIARFLPPGASCRQISNYRIVVENVGADEQQLLNLVDRVQAGIALRQIDIRDMTMAVTLSAGIAIAAGASHEDLETAAQQALWRATADGAGGIRIVHGVDDVERTRSDVMEIAQATCGALDAGHITLAYQPVVSANNTGFVSFYECLARIREPNGLVRPAGSFMPVVERLGMAPLIDRQVLVMTFEALARHPERRFSVNVFPETMQDAQWLLLFDRCARQMPGLADRLIIEVSETSSLLDISRTQRFLDRIREYGTALAIDDFGAGNTSIAHLRDFRFDILKIDGRFIQKIVENSDHAFLVEKIVEIGQRFDLMSVAEFVETRAQIEILARAGVDALQGYYFGAPSLLLDLPTNDTPAEAV